MFRKKDWPKRPGSERKCGGRSLLGGPNDPITAFSWVQICKNVKKEGKSQGRVKMKLAKDIGSVCVILICSVGNDGWDTQEQIILAGTKVCSGESATANFICWTWNNLS